MSDINPFEVAARFAKSVKQADPNPALAGPTMNQLNWNSTVGDVTQMGLGALAVGAGARGLTGLYNLMTERATRPRNTYPGAMVTRIPIPVQDDEDDKPHHRRKVVTATDGGPPVTDYRNGALYMPAMMGAGALGLYGGWKGVDALLQHQRDQASKQKVEDARKDFEQALLESYPKPRKPSGIPGLKVSQDEQESDGQKLSRALDDLYDKLQEKRAFDWSIGGMVSPDTTQNLAGMYGTYALGSGLLAGKLTYDAGMKNNGQTVLRKAIARRARRQAMQRPSEILAVPDEVNTGHTLEPGGMADEDAGRDADSSESGMLDNVKARSRSILRGIV